MKMKRVLIAFAMMCSLNAYTDTQLEQFYSTYKNTILKWDGIGYREITSTEQRVEITIENHFIYIYDSYGNHSTYKYNGFIKNKMRDAMISKATDNSGAYCELILNRTEGNGLCLSIVYSEQIIIKYYLK